MENNFSENVVLLPESVEMAIARICREQNKPPLANSTKQALAEKGEQFSLRILDKIQRTVIRFSFDGLVSCLIKAELNNNGSPSPQKRPSPSQQNCSPMSSPAKTCRLMMNSQVDLRVDDFVQTPKTPPLRSSIGRSETFSPQLLVLGELEFRKAFLILSYIGSERLEEVTTADEILMLKDLPMDTFEEEVWVSLGRHYAPSNRCKSLEWESGRTYEYYCDVSEDGSCRFKGPCVDKSRSHLQRVLGDDNVLIVKFANVTESSAGNNDSFSKYNKIAKTGILVGLRRYRFFVFKDGRGKKRGKEARKRVPNFSSVRCIFVRFESDASIDQGKDYVLSGKTIQEARHVFMHVHTLSNVAKYIPRFSLILSKSMALELDFANLKFECIEDVLCRDKDGNPVCKNDGEPFIHTDGTGFISEDLALKCPRNVSKGSVMSGDNVEGKFSDMKSAESQHRLPPLLIQCRLFYNGYAVKGTLLVNKKLPPRTIQVRPSMIKVEPDLNLSNTCARNSLEVVATSNQPRKTFLSQNLVLLLSYGGVPDDFFMDILKNALEVSRSVYSNKRSAIKVSLNRGGMDDLNAAKMILSGIPLDESFLQYHLSIMMNEERKGLLEGKLPVTESYYLMGSVDPSGILESDEVCIILDNGQISGKVLVYRNPGLHFGDVHVLNARYVKSLDEYVGHAKYAILFPSKGPRSLADEMAGGDFDGDMFFVSRNPQLLDYFRVSEPWIENSSTCGVPSKKPTEFSDGELEDKLFKLFLKIRFRPSYAMSTTADNWKALMDRLLTLEDSNSTEKVLVRNNLVRLIDLYYEALDAPKSGKEIEVPEDLIVSVFPHYMERENSFKSTSILGKIYDRVKSYGEEVSRTIEVRKLPCFDVDFPIDCGEKWTKLYEQYGNNMKDALSGESKEHNDKAANVVYDKYKQKLYGAAELEQTQRPLDQIYDEALAIYNISYNNAIRWGDVGKCGFAWKVAGSALLSWYASNQGEKMLSCAPSVLKDLFT